ncbi:MAG: hypothetical protein ABL952_18115, partial [Pyrinomonadaceae bacterium]
MRILKLAVTFAFAAVFGAFFLAKSGPVSGQKGGDALTVPTGVIATDSVYNNKVGIYWDAIKGATTYRIFRNAVNDPASATQVGTTPQNFFFD